MSTDNQPPAVRAPHEVASTGHESVFQANARTQDALFTSAPDTDYGRFLQPGFWILILGFGGFLAWAIWAPLDEAIPATGAVVVENSRKRIEHLHGGIVEHISVREGQRVNAGDELLVLNETQGRSALNALQTQWFTALATLARLRTEREGGSSIAFPPELIAAAAHDAEIQALLRTQEDLLRTRRQALDGELRIIRESVRGLEIQLASLAQLRQGRETQIALFNEQLASFRDLRSQGFVSRNNLLELERQLAEVQSKLSEDMSNIAGVNARLSEFRMRGNQREMEYRREIESQITDLQREVATLGERLSAQRDTVERLVLRAPVDGIVVDLAIHTIGGVVKPGDRVMDIVPDGDNLIIEARLAPQYIDRVRPGLPADVHLELYSTRVERPVVGGEVIGVSADVLHDPRNGDAYFTMRVRVEAEEVSKLRDIRLQPGMPTTVMIKTGERSLMVYLLQPLRRRFGTALTEG